ncbi:MAG TPA: efflux RND transporter permease subunit [Kofleriaceae bacterium]|nr:efflux RND transporter permease subunit [Kofleriaceae bacterium]
MIPALVRNSSTVLLISFCVLLFGGLTYKELPREAAPDVKVPLVIATTPYPGVSPEDIETLVTTPIENEMSGLKKLKKLSSTSAEGVSIITLEFDPEVDIEDALQRVRDRLSRAKPELPADVEDTDISEISFAEMPIMIATIAGPIGEEGLKEIGEKLEEQIERIPGVLAAELSGGRTRQIRVQIDPVRLGHYGLSLDDVIAAVQNENVNIPGGDVAVGDASYLLRVPGEIDDPAELENLAIKRKGDRPVFIRDIGQVIDGFANRATYARMNGEVAVSLAISKRTGANIPDVAARVKQLLADESASWPEGVEYRILGDQSKMIADVVSDLENGIITALILVVGVLMFFMGVRNSLFVAVAIPLSFLLGIMAISLFGMTLNMVVLFALILVLGMLVDNAIVIVENVYRHAELGKPIKQAAIDGTREVATAVAASTATTVAAFVPLIFWTGIMGEFMGYMPKTVVIVLIASLVVALGVLPVVTGRLLKAKPPKHVGVAPELGRIMRTYRSVLGFSIRHRYISAVAGLLTLIGSCAAYAQLNHGTEFFPDSDPNRAVITVRAADGTDIEATDAIVRKIEAILAAEENVDVYVAEVGVSGSGQDPIAGSQSASNSARITVDFLPDTASARAGDKVRIERTPLTVERVRLAIAEVPGAEISIEKELMGPPVGAPIAVEISGDDFHAVGAYAALARRELSQIEGAAKLTDDYRVGRPEMRLRIDRAAAKRVGASTREVAGTIRTAIAGTKASTLRDGEDDYDIVVELDPRYKADLQAVLAMRIPGRLDTSPDIFAVPLSAVARDELAGGSGSIRHIDQQKVVTVEGQIAEGFNENAVRAKVVEWIERADPPEGIAIRLGGANDEQAAAQAFLGRAFLIAIFLIAIVLVAQFNRFDIPLIILATVVLSLIGVLWGLILTGTAFGVIMTGLGVISLAGVVVNNAIVLLDYVEQLRARGVSFLDALIEAGTARFRPVFLTALTTILGLLPMALGIAVNFSKLTITTGSQTTQFWRPMAVAVIFGLAFATILTLIMVPTMYSIAEDVRTLPARLRRRLRRRPPG